MGRTVSTSATHALWFRSFPGAAATQMLLSQAEAAAAAQLNQQSAAENATAKDSAEITEAKLHKANIALGQIILKLVEVVREKAALEEENASLRARLALAEEAALEAASRTSGGGSSAVNAAAAAAAAIEALSHDDPIQAEAARVAQTQRVTGTQPVLEPGVVLGRMALMRDGINAAVELALPQSAYASLPRVEEIVKRSSLMVANVADGEVSKLLNDASDQLHTASLQLQRTNAAIRLAVAAEVGAAARFMVSAAIGEALPATSAAGTLSMAYATVRGPSEAHKNPRPALPMLQQQQQQRRQQHSPGGESSGIGSSSSVGGKVPRFSPF